MIHDFEKVIARLTKRLDNLCDENKKLILRLKLVHRGTKSSRNRI
jgi:hypothetical protein